MCIRDSGNDGRLALRNPLNCANSNFISFINSMKWGEKLMPLKPGLLLMWPAFLEHGTFVNETPADRISFSFNVTLSKPPYINTISNSEAEKRSHLYIPSELPAKLSSK